MLNLFVQFWYLSMLIIFVLCLKNKIQLLSYEILAVSMYTLLKKVSYKKRNFCNDLKPSY